MKSNHTPIHLIEEILCLALDHSHATKVGSKGPLLLCPFVVFFFFCPFSADRGGQAKLAHSKMLKETREERRGKACERERKSQNTGWCNYIFGTFHCRIPRREATWVRGFVKCFLIAPQSLLPRQARGTLRKLLTKPLTKVVARQNKRSNNYMVSSHYIHIQWSRQKIGSVTHLITLFTLFLSRVLSRSPFRRLTPLAFSSFPPQRTSTTHSDVSESGPKCLES